MCRECGLRDKLKRPELITLFKEASLGYVFDCLFGFPRTAFKFLLFRRAEAAFASPERRAAVMSAEEGLTLRQFVELLAMIANNIYFDVAEVRASEARAAALAGEKPALGGMAAAMAARDDMEFPDLMSKMQVMSGCAFMFCCCPNATRIHVCECIDVVFGNE